MESTPVRRHGWHRIAAAVTIVALTAVLTTCGPSTLHSTPATPQAPVTTAPAP